MKKRIISMIMVIVMVITMFPVYSIPSTAQTSSDFKYEIISEVDKTAKITGYVDVTGGMDKQTAIETFEACATGHTPGEWVVIFAPTCYEPGMQSLKCATCNEYFDAEEIPPTYLHTPSDWIIDIEPTCTENGSKHKECIVCGKIVGDILEVEKIPATGIHAPGEWLIEIPPTCQTAGAKSKYCTACGELLATEVVPTVDHEFDDWHVNFEPSCSEPGILSRCCVYNCGTNECMEIPATGNHTYSEWIVDVEPTCIEEGSKHKECIVCGKTLETETISATGHTAGDWIIDIEPTCIEDGFKYKECTICFEIVDAEDIPATDIHTPSGWIIDVEPTCTENGSKHKKCTVCGEILETEMISATGHTSSGWIVDLEPTCTEEGCKHKECTVCGAYVDADMIPPTGVHSLSGWIIDLNPTCTAKGSKHKDCLVCYETLETETIPATNHSTGCTCFEYYIISETDKTVGISDYNGSETELEIPSVINGYTVTEIESWTFAECKSLTTVTIPNSVTTIGVGVFSGCESLTSINVDIDNQCFSNDEYGVLFNKDKTELIQYPAGNSRTEYIIPENVTTLGHYAFYGCSLLKSIIIPEGVTMIGAIAFKDCTSLEEVVYLATGFMPDLGESSAIFLGCINLKTIHFGKNAFLEILKYSNDTEEINLALGYLVRFTAITSLSDGITGSLVNITVDEDHPYLCTVDNAIYTKDMKYLWVIPNGFSGDFVVPDGVEFIAYAFYGCSKLKSVTIPKSVTIIADAFAFNSSLTTINYDGCETKWTKITENAGDLSNVTINCKPHSGETVSISPTCTESGNESLTCIYCGETSVEAVDALGHDFSSDFTIDKNPTCVEDGSKSRHCSRCDEKTDITPISKLTEDGVHNSGGYWVTIKEPTCDNRYLTGGIYFGSGVQVCRCKLCDDVLETHYIDPLGHLPSSNWVVTKEPTCCEEGEKTSVCLVCGETITDSIYRLDHSFGETKYIVTPTCTEMGRGSHSCTECGYSEYFNVETLPHNFGEWQIKTEALIGELGEIEHSCTDCGHTETTEYLVGDVNDDGKVDKADYDLIIQVVTLSKTLTYLEEIFADVNYDGAVDAFDAVCIDLMLKDMLPATVLVDNQQIAIIPKQDEEDE